MVSHYRFGQFADPYRQMAREVAAGEGDTLGRYNRKQIGGIHGPNSIAEYFYPDAQSPYVPGNLQALGFRPASKTQRYSGGGNYEARGVYLRYNTVFTIPSGVTEMAILAIGAGGGAAGTGSNRGGAGGSGGGLSWAVGTTQAGRQFRIITGVSGYHRLASYNYGGVAGGSSGVQDIFGNWVVRAYGGGGGRPSLSSGASTPNTYPGGNGNISANSTGYFTVTASGGGNGGTGGGYYYNSAGGGGGGAGGYSGDGGQGSYSNSNFGGTNGAGGGGAGGRTASSYCQGGGGTGIYGQGSSGTISPGLTTNGGSGGENGATATYASNGGDYGGGGGADDDDLTTSGTNYNGYGGRGCVVIQFGFGVNNYPALYNHGFIQWTDMDNSNSTVFSDSTLNT